MTAYRASLPPYQSLSHVAQEAKAKRRAVLRRVRAQRAAAQKRTVSDWIQAGAIIRGSELRERLRGK